MTSLLAYKCLENNNIQPSQMQRKRKKTNSRFISIVLRRKRNALISPVARGVNCDCPSIYSPPSPSKKKSTGEICFFIVAFIVAFFLGFFLSLSEKEGRTETVRRRISKYTTPYLRRKQSTGSNSSLAQYYPSIQLLVFSRCTYTSTIPWWIKRKNSHRKESNLIFLKEIFLSSEPLSFFCLEESFFLLTSYSHLHKQSSSTYALFIKKLANRHTAWRTLPARNDISPLSSLFLLVLFPLHSFVLSL